MPDRFRAFSFGLAPLLASALKGARDGAPKGTAGMFTWQRAKAVGRDFLFSLPRPVAVLVTSVAYRLGLINRTWHVYSSLGAPKRVLHGPFAGMEYRFHATASSQILPKFIGTYELEIASAVREIVTTKPDVVIDIGAADGFYAVGLAMLTAGRVIAFDTDHASHSLLRANARRNGVETLMDVRGACDHAALEQALWDARRPLVLLDCEGYEAVLLDPVRVPRLRSANILVELHEAKAPGVEEVVATRFRETHVMRVFHTRPRTLEDWPSAARSLRVSDAMFALDERRSSAQSWYWLVARSQDIKLAAF